MKAIVKKASVFAFTLFFGVSSFAQTQMEMPSNQEKSEQNDIPKKELKQFASALVKVQEVNQKTQAKMIKAVETEGMTVERYNEVLQAQNQEGTESDATPEEQKSFEAVSTKIQSLQQESEVKMKANIEEEGLSITRYQEIAAMVQNDPELQQKLQTFMEG